MTRLAAFANRQGIEAQAAVSLAVKQAQAALDIAHMWLQKYEASSQADDDDRLVFARIKYDLERLKAEYNL